MNRWIITFFLTLLLGGAWLWWSRVPIDADETVREPEPAVGHPAPDFALTTLEGEPFTLSDLDGTPVVLNFWATWCGPCRNELPALQDAAERYDGRIVFVGVDQAEEAEVVQSFVDEFGLTFPIPLDHEGSVGQRYNVRGLPTTFFIDGNGLIRNIWSGEMNAITLAEQIADIQN